MPSSREEEVKVKVTGADQGARDLEKIGGTAKVAGESVKGLGREADKAAKDVDDLGDEAKQTASQLESLERQVLKAKIALKALGDEYANVGDEKVGVEFDKQAAALAKIEARSRTIAKLAKDLAPKREEGGPARVVDLLDGRRERRGGFFGAILGAGSAALNAGGRVAEQGASKLTDMLTDVSPSGVLKLAAGAAAAPGIATLAGGAALAGGAFAGAGLGIAGAIANNPEPFKKAWADAIQDVSRRWQNASAGFEKPALNAFAIMKSAVDDIHIEEILKSAQKYVEPLAHGIAGFVKPLAEGIGLLVEKAGPVVDVLERDLPILGRAFKTALGDIGEGADGSAAALDVLVKVIASVVVAVGTFIKGASEAYGWLSKHADVFGMTDKAAMSYGRTLETAAQKTSHYVDVQKLLTDAANAAADAQRKEFGIMLSAGEAADRATEATQKLNEQFRENGYILDGNSEKALENREVMRQTIRAWQDDHDAAIEAAGGTKEAIAGANAVLLKHLEDLRAVLKAHGQNTAEVDAYIAKLKEAMSLKLSDQSITIHVNYDTNGLPRNLGSRYGGTDNYASGGDVRRTGMALVGERGPEYRLLSRGDHMFNAADTARMRASSGGGSSSSGGSSQPRTVRFAGKTDSAFATAFMQLVRAGLIQIS